MVGSWRSRMIDWYVNNIHREGRGGCDLCILGYRGRQEPIRVAVCGWHRIYSFRMFSRTWQLFAFEFGIYCWFLALLLALSVRSNLFNQRCHSSPSCFVKSNGFGGLTFNRACDVCWLRIAQRKNLENYALNYNRKLSFDIRWLIYEISWMNKHRTRDKNLHNHKISFT